MDSNFNGRYLVRGRVRDGVGERLSTRVNAEIQIPVIFSLRPTRNDSVVDSILQCV